ncbi:MAG: TonB-dependent receptor [Bacteroidota bacterium]
MKKYHIELYLFSFFFSFDKRVIIYSLSLIIFLFNHLFSQNLKDTIHLQSVDIYPAINEMKSQTFDAGKNIQHTDSTLLQIFSLNSLSDILNYQTSIFIKNYAPGSIGTASIRGGNAQQTTVLWNGVNINHPMLGQTDCSQITSNLFDNISIEYGGASSLWGNGALSGSIRLNNSFSNENKMIAKYRYGSFNTHQYLFKNFYNRKKIKHYLNLNFQQSQNNFSIGDSIRLQNAQYKMLDALFGFSYQFNQHHHLELHSWSHIANNQIPNNYFYNKYSALQNTKNFRNALDYIFQKNQWKAGIKLTYLFDDLNYKDSIARINSFSKVHSFQTEENVYKNIFQDFQIFIGHQFIYNYAITNNYLNNEYISRHSVFAGIRQTSKKFKYNAIIRKEWANIQTSIPLTGNIGAEYILHPLITLKSQLSTSYRLPTLNDLFWKGSGDVSLKPENGYSVEGGVLWKIPLHSLHLQLHSEMTAFHRITNNWIIWLPGGSGQPVPKNIARVWSRGTETNNYLLYQIHKTKIKLSVSSAYVLSTIEKSSISNDASIGRQLIYTPRYNINGYFYFSYKNIFLLFTHQYVGYRFISSDNLQWLEPYHINNISAGFNINFKDIALQLFGGINNLFNTSYMIIPQRPMPLRNYFIQINITFYENKNHQ